MTFGLWKVCVCELIVTNANTSEAIKWSMFGMKHRITVNHFTKYAAQWDKEPCGILQVMDANFALPDLRLHRLRACMFLPEALTQI
jgi:hypothetical protein